jgi:hypothetical protein
MKVVLNDDSRRCRTCNAIHPYWTFKCIAIAWPNEVVIGGKKMVAVPKGLKTIPYELTRKPEHGGPPKLN